MALSSSYNYVTTRDLIIARALRIIGALGQGETPQATAVTEASYALNDIYKEWQSDGLQLWKYLTQGVPLVASTRSYTVGVSKTLNIAAPWKVVQAQRQRVEADGTVNLVPLIQCSFADFNRLTPTLLEGTPTHFHYVSPTSDGTQMNGSLVFWPVPDSNFVSGGGGTGSVNIQYMAPFMDFDSSTDNPDIPNYLINALVWALADQLAYEYGVPIADRAQITKKAQTHKAVALSFDQEEGSLFLQPYPNWEEA